MATELPEEELARKAYNAWANAQQWKDGVMGTPMVRWEALREDVRQAWSQVVLILKMELEKEAAQHQVQDRHLQEQRRQAQAGERQGAHGTAQSEAPRTGVGRP